MLLVEIFVCWVNTTTGDSVKEKGLIHCRSKDISSSCLYPVPPWTYPDSCPAVSEFRSPSATIFRVYNVNIRSTVDVTYGEILQDLVHCINGIKFLRSSTNRHKIWIKMVMCLGREISRYTGWQITAERPEYTVENTSMYSRG